MEDYVGLLAYVGSVHHANTAQRVCSVRSIAFVCISGQLQTIRGESYRIYDIASQRPKTLSMEDYVGLLAYVGTRLVYKPHWYAACVQTESGRTAGS